MTTLGEGRRDDPTPVPVPGAGSPRPGGPGPGPPAGPELAPTRSGRPGPPPARPAGPGRPAAAGPLPRVPFPTVDEVSRHCFQEQEPETIHIEIHLPGRPEPGRLRDAFHQALRRHPRILMRQASSNWWRRWYEWELTDGPDLDPVSFPLPAADALAAARARALDRCPPLELSPPIRLEQVTTPDEPGCVLLLTINHTALDGPSALRILATAATLYSGREDAPAPPPARAASGPGPTRWASRSGSRTARGGSRPARIAADTRTPGTPGNGMLLLDLPVPARPPHPGRGSPGTEPGGGTAVRPTVNDRLLVATCLTAARWNHLHDRPAAPVRITMPVDDRSRAAEMPIGNGTRLVEVGFGRQERTDAELLTAEHPDPAAVARLVHRTAELTRALKARPTAQLGVAGTLLTAPLLPVGLRAALTRGVRRAAAPWTSTTLLSNIGRVAFPLDFGDAGRARAVWFSAPARMPRGLTFTCASTGGRLHLTLRWSRALLDDAAGAALAEIVTRALSATAPADPRPAAGTPSSGGGGS
ncbi:condensation protein [Streptomyces sp. XD-27]|uniref:condensation protein n=1 Tax=Streptomyces sp. XD-27 TaxID=3062779 RepID=UPI0026F43AE4|nr:condensation protein [Streptomyces sp. XD-27]WKX69286.1 condensation protein [Streptomyces sp. XD-27]